MAKANSTAVAAALTQRQITYTVDKLAPLKGQISNFESEGDNQTDLHRIGLAVRAMSMHPQAAGALRAARLYPTIGRFAARRYCERHGIPTRLYYLARQLAAA